jgi:hypothetical protein
VFNGKDENFRERTSTWQAKPCRLLPFTSKGLKVMDTVDKTNRQTYIPSNYDETFT